MAKRIQAANSFTKDQVQILAFVVDTLLRGGDARMAVRHKAFAGLAAKVHKMRDTVRSLERKRQGGKDGTVKNGEGDG